jgi:hypothetical protein
MSQSRRWRVFVSLLVAVLVVGALISVLRPREVRQVIASPDGNFVLVATVNRSKADPGRYLCVAFDVTDARGVLLDHHQTGASHVMRWNIGWLGNDTIRLESSDVGTYLWERREDGHWHVTQPPVNW